MVVIPCNTTDKSASEWVSYYKDIYPGTSRQGIAVGAAGETLFKCKELFSALYFDNADLGSGVEADKERFYYIGQCDEDAAYQSANALYKSCKQQGASFEYRCRNHLDDQRADFLTGFEYIKSNLYNF